MDWRLNGVRVVRVDEYELIAGRSATRFLRTIANTGNDGLMLPEQVWDDQPPRRDPAARGALATPLAWTHGRFVRLARSIDAGLPIERPSIAACPVPAGAVSVTRASLRRPRR